MRRVVQLLSSIRLPAGGNHCLSGLQDSNDCLSYRSGDIMK